VDALKDLEDPAEGDGLGGFAKLIRESLIVVKKGLTQLVFGQSIDQQAEAHHHAKSHDARRGLEKETMSEEERVLQEAKATFNRNILPLVQEDKLVEGKTLLIQVVGG
jgi:hypothetical protein